MKIILNSDVLYANSLIKDSLTRNITKFIEECKKYNHIIVIPLTTLYEFENKQGEFLEKEKSKIKQAVTDLNIYEIEVADFDIGELIKLPDLIKLIEKTEVSCEIAKPTKEDFDEAHRKACFHDSPHPPDIKSDEMRDLVIWEISLRISKEENGAILISNDKVHKHHRGDYEASENNLLRFDNFERAKEALDIETTSAKRIKQLLKKNWDELISSDLPLGEGSTLISVKKPKFIDSDEGITQVNASLTFRTGDGKELATTIDMKFVDDMPLSIRFSDIIVDDKQNVEPLVINLAEFEMPEADFEKRLKNLKELF